MSKWTCPTCTFSNWPTSTKCVLCSCVRPNEVSAQWPQQGGSNCHPSLAWSKISQCEASHSPEFNRKKALSSDGQTHTQKSYYKGTKCKTKAKWTCVGCTYSNWNNAHQCIMCGSPKGKTLKGESGGKNNPNRSFPLTENILDYASSKGAVGGACFQDDQESQARPVRLKKEARNVKGNLEKKWKCPKCTYDNFQRSTVCVMCQYLKRQPSSPESSCEEAGKDPSHLTPLHESRSTSHNHNHPTTATNNSNLSLKSSINSTSVSTKSNKPDTVTNSSLSDTDPSLSPSLTMASSRQNDSETRLISYSGPSAEEARDVDRLEITPPSQLKSVSNEVRQIRNRLTNSDWLFLNACLGIVNNEVLAVQSYVRQVGDRSRQLTGDECLVLGQQHTFSVGSTLVHLAIR